MRDDDDLVLVIDDVAVAIKEAPPKDCSIIPIYSNVKARACESVSAYYNQ